MKDGKRTDLALLLMRIGLGLIMMYFGSGKMFPIFGGLGFQGQVAAFERSGFPAPLGILAIVAEFFGGLGILVGFLTPVAAFGIACTMAVATYQNATRPGLVQTVFSTGGADAQSLFFPAALFFLAVGVMLLGAGRFSVDAKLFGGKRGK
jgi:putative oxidoreductase